MAEQYEKAAAATQKEIEVWYARFAKNENITMTEAKRMLTTRELKEFKWTVEEYIEKGKTSNYSDRWAKQLENASARFHVSRLEALQIQMQQQAEMLHGYELDGLDELAQRIYSDGYYQTAYAIQKGVGVGWDFMKLDTNRIKQVISKPWAADGSNFSARIWKSRTQLVATLNDTLVQSIIRGQNPAQTLDVIKKRFDVSRHQAGRLIMTESAFFATAGQRDAFKALDVDKYQIVATLDSHTSEICQALDGKVLPMSDFKPGVTAPPFHAFCRSCTVPYFEDDVGERAARDKDGKYYTVPSTMTYKDWKKTFVDGGGKGGLEQIGDVLTVLAPYVSKFVPAASVKEAEAYADQFVDSCKGKYSGKVSYKGMDLEYANKVNKVLTDVYDQYDIETLANITPMNFRENKWKNTTADAAYQWGGSGGNLFFNPHYYSSGKALTAHIQEADDLLKTVLDGADRLLDKPGLRDEQRRYIEALLKTGTQCVAQSVDDFVEATFVHELGHSLDDKIFRKAFKESGFNPSESLLKFGGNISGYAVSSNQEYIAESFTAYWYGKTEALDPDLVKIFESAKKSSASLARGIETAGASAIMKPKVSLAKVIPDEKLVGYALNPLKAPDKARAFKSALGYDASNYEKLKQNIMDHVDETKFVAKSDEGYGMRYEYIVELTGENGKKANVLTAWIQDGEDKRLTSTYVTKKKVTS